MLEITTFDFYVAKWNFSLLFLVLLALLPPPPPSLPPYPSSKPSPIFPSMTKRKNQENTIFANFLYYSVSIPHWNIHTFIPSLLSFHHLLYCSITYIHEPFTLHQSCLVSNKNELFWGGGGWYFVYFMHGSSNSHAHYMLLFYWADRL